MAETKALIIEPILAKLRKQSANGKLLIKNRIYRVGVELEGGWKKVPKGVELVHDGSIRGLVAKKKPVDPDRLRGLTPEQQYILVNTEAMENVLSVGEIPSEVLVPEAVDGWIKKNYPTHVNESCGLHVHMSFKKALHYSRLMVPEYPQTILAYMAKWAIDEKLPTNHPMWQRLKGDSQYCKLDFFPDEQAQQARKVYDHSMKGHRYTVINYCHAKSATIECRLLPMMDTAEQGIRAVNRVLDITNACLFMLKGKEVKHSSDIKVDTTLAGIDETNSVFI